MVSPHNDPPQREFEDLLETRLTVTVPEAARLLSISRSTAYSAARAGQLPTVRMGRRLLVPTHALRDLLGLHPERGERNSNAG